MERPRPMGHPSDVISAARLQTQCALVLSERRQIARLVFRVRACRDGDPMTTTLTRTRPALTARVVLPSNIIPIASQAELYGYGVRYLTFVQVADEAEAVERAGIE